MDITLKSYDGKLVRVEASKKKNGCSTLLYQHFANRQHPEGCVHKQSAEGQADQLYPIKDKVL